MKRLYWLLLIPVILIGALWITRAKSSAPEIRFAKARRETLISNLPTNGKVEPIEWAAVRVDAPGLVKRLLVQQGQTVARGALLAQLSEPGLTDQVSAAEARVAQARSDLDVLGKGGKSSELTEIDNSLTRLRFDRDQQAKEYGSLKRLYEKQAATMVEMQTAQARLRQFEIDIDNLGKRRAALVSKADVASGEARLREAQWTVRATQAKVSQTIIRSPVAGVVYSLPARLGSYLSAGDLVASIGQLDRLRVRVYVDEPELGRVAVGQSVRITWDAQPDRTWKGIVERLPTEITALGTRQVGEVICTIDNPGHQLVPGTNINAFIETSVNPGALTIPKEAVRREAGVTDVYVLESNGVVRSRRVETGASSVTRTQIIAGLKEDEAVALASDKALKDGDKVKPVF
ncbi:MAG: efflux RND transporter periplasmic adaptor subunit [Acidobacteriota bacterium]|nr:efflux RND transporter periplasmic adaptor subunit [Acidobacteriota bacterium]